MERPQGRGTVFWDKPGIDIGVLITQRRGLHQGSPPHQPAWFFPATAHNTMWVCTHPFSLILLPKRAPALTYVWLHPGNLLDKVDPEPVQSGPSLLSAPEMHDP